MQDLLHFKSIFLFMHTIFRPPRSWGPLGDGLIWMMRIRSLFLLFFKRMYGGDRGRPRIATDCNGLQQIPMDRNRSQQIARGCNGLQWIATNRKLLFAKMMTRRKKPAAISITVIDDQGLKLVNRECCC